MRDVTADLDATGIGEAQLTGLLALALDRSPDAILHYAISIIAADGDGDPQMVVISSLGSNRKAAAVILRHGAEHMLGRCGKCSRSERRAFRGNR